MKADFICVFNTKDKKIENVAYKELVENDYLIPADEWCDFLINYDEVIRAIIIDNVSSIYINPLDNPPKAYNELNDCFEMAAICLYKKLRESAIELFHYSSTRHWYFGLKTLTYSWHKEEFIEKNYNTDYDTIIENEFVPIAIWKSFVAKRRFGNLIPNYMSNKQAYRKARDIFLKEYNINRKEFLYGYEE